MRAVCYPPPPPPSPFLLVTLPPSVTCVQACCLSQVAPHLVRGATPHLIHTPPPHTSFFLFHALVLYCGNCLGPGFCWVGQGGSRTLAHLDGVGNREGGRGEGVGAVLTHLAWGKGSEAEGVTVDLQALRWWFCLFRGCSCCGC